MDFLDEFIIPVILGICLCIGMILKSWLSDASHKYIPATVAILGVVLALWMNPVSYTHLTLPTIGG